MGTRPPRRGLGGGRRAHRGIAGSIRQNPPGARRFLPARGRLEIPAPEDLEEVEVAARPVAVGRQGERPPAVVVDQAGGPPGLVRVVGDELRPVLSLIHISEPTRLLSTSYAV